jgi:hypothetical protein
MVKLFTIADKDIPTAGTRVQVTSTSTIITTVVFQAKTTNTGVVIIGDSNVAAGQGLELSPGETLAITADMSGRSGGDELDLSDFWLDTATNGNDVKISYIKRK